MRGESNAKTQSQRRRSPPQRTSLYNVLARTQAECKAKLREAVRSAQQGSTSGTPQKPKERSTEAAQSDSIFTVGEWLRTWYDLYTKPNIRATTQEYYSNFIEHHLIPRIGEIPLDKLTGLRLQKLYQELRTDGKVRQNKNNPGLSPKTIRGIHMMLHSALEQAVKEELIKKNPTNDCSPPKAEKKEMRVIKPEQIGTYLQAAANRTAWPALEGEICLLFSGLTLTRTSTRSP